MTRRTVLDVGNCVPDHAAIKRLVSSNFDAAVVQSHGIEDTLDVLRSRAIDLVLINRKLDQDYSDGTEVLKQIKADAALQSIPVMIITNYAEHQDAAEALGAVRGFGKLEYSDPSTTAKLAAFLE